MRNQLVFDVPTRLFHWLFASLFVGSFLLAKLYGHRSLEFPYHMLLGMTLVFVTVLRVAWGFVGTRYARWSSFELKPSSLVKYFADIFRGRSVQQHLGHNAATSWAAIGMVALSFGLGVTGYLMTAGINKKFFEEVHELMANGFLLIALLHVAGIIAHLLRHRDGVALTMVDGQKAPIEGSEPISTSRPLAGAILLILVGLFALNLQQSYEPATKRLTVLGSTWQLGKSGPKGDSGGKSGRPREVERHEERHD